MDIGHRFRWLAVVADVDACSVVVVVTETLI